MRTMFGWSISLGIALLVAAPAMSQERPATRPAAPGGAPRGTAISQRDQDLAHCLVNANKNEIEIAKFALDRLESKEAKDFAEMLIKDHTKALETFSRFDPQVARTSTSSGAAAPRTNRGTIERPVSAPEEPRVKPAPREAGAPDRAAGDRPAADRPARPTSRPAGERPVATDARPSGDKVALNWRQIGDELAAQCLATAKKELDKKEGNEFEKCFLGMQVAAHMKMVDELTVFEKHASDELASEIAKARETTKKHLDHAKDLMEEKKDLPDEKPADK